MSTLRDQQLKQPDRTSRPTDVPFSSVSQRYFLEDTTLTREVSAGRFSGRSVLSGSYISKSMNPIHLAKIWSVGYLKGWPIVHGSDNRRNVRVVDLFCGAGGLSAGLEMAAAAVGLRMEPVACVDLDEVALDIFAANFAVKHRLKKNVDAIVDYLVRHDGGDSRFAYPPELLEPDLSRHIGDIDIVMGGPPCQGHSNFNNHSRRIDPKNALYLTVPAVGIALNAGIIVVENVPSILNDKNKVVDKARSLLRERGYFVDSIILDAARFGTPQDRKRHFLVAMKCGPVDLKSLTAGLESPPLRAWDAIGDIENFGREDDFDVPAELSPENKARIEWLFENDEYNLPNDIRPDCHKDGHSYPSVYGRLFLERPAQTITGGFLSPGRGRYVHPTQRRGLTPHEGARLQGFSDSFRFRRQSGKRLLRKNYAKLIGDAVPPPLAYAVGLACVAGL